MFLRPFPAPVRPLPERTRMSSSSARCSGRSKKQLSSCSALLRYFTLSYHLTTLNSFDTTANVPAHEWSRGDATDIDGRTEGRNERERMSQSFRSWLHPIVRETDHFTQRSKTLRQVLPSPIISRSPVKMKGRG